MESMVAACSNRDWLSSGSCAVVRGVVMNTSFRYRNAAGRAAAGLTGWCGGGLGGAGHCGSRWPAGGQRDERRADRITPGDGGQPLSVRAQGAGEDRHLLLAQLGVAGGHVPHRAVMLAQLLPDADLLQGG